MPFPILKGKYFTVLLLLLAGTSVSVAQHNPYDFYINNSGDGFIAGPDNGDDAVLFGIAGSEADDIFTVLSEYNFGQVRHNRRGLPFQSGRIFVSGIDISGGFVSRADYSLSSALRRARFPVRTYGGTDVPYFGGLSPGTTKHYFAYSDHIRGRNDAAVFGSNRKGRFGMRGHVSPKSTERFNSYIGFYGRAGRDKSIKGVFTEEASLYGGVNYNFKERHKLILFFTGTLSSNGLRSYTTAEAYELTGKGFYNPSWGYFNGKVRNTKVRENCQPVVLLGYDLQLNAGSTLSVSSYLRVGESASSGLSWFNAATPYPDYYRYMPSYQDNPVVGEFLTGLWNASEPSVTQTDWDMMYEANSLNTDRAAYFLEERVESVRDRQIAITYHYNPNILTSVFAGVRLRNDYVRMFKRMKDLLGGLPIEDTDQYLFEDEIFGGQSANNVRTPGRRITKGDRFGYDTVMNGISAEAFVSGSYLVGSFALSGIIEAGYASVQREGKYEKELYPDGLSYGKSQKIGFETWSAKASVGYAPSPAHRFTVSGMMEESTPDYGSIFISPYYTNATVRGIQTVRTTSFDAGYKVTFPTVVLNIVYYHTRTGNGSAVYSYYDDIMSVYSHMTLDRIGTKNHGVELGGEVEISSALSFRAGFSFGRYEYATDPVVDIMKDATLETYVTSSKSYMKGYRVGNSPEQLFTGELKYNRRGWLATITLNHMGGRYVAPNPLRRMDRAFNLAASPEKAVGFVAQERLGNATTIDLFMMKSFKIGTTGFSVLCSVNNLMNTNDIIYNGYEQMRIMKKGSGINRVYTPFPNKYLYAYGRTIYTSFICRF